METHVLTDEERERMLDGLFTRLNIQRWHPTRQELEREIEDYLLKNHPCSLATCGTGGAPRVSVVDYVNEDLNIYIFSEGGRKFKNIAENNRVAIGIGTSARTITSVRGVNIQGQAEVFTEDQPEFSHALTLFRPMLDDFEQRTGAPVVFPPGMVRVIRITPLHMVYFHYMKGIAHECWEPL
jgi:nitroimidazol reductase NimA-like FMN-containing flavoprotein (pyridoxamine 5'-phosphate oxidase superfamily)